MNQVMEKFKLSKNTKELIANFSNINKSMFFKKGKRLGVMSVNGDIVGFVDIEEEIPQDFAIYDLSKFLSILSTFNNPTLTFAEQHVIIADDTRKKYKYRYTSPNSIIHPTKSSYEFEEVINFTLKATDLANMIKVVSISKHPEVAFVGENGDLILQAHDEKGANTDVYENVLSNNVSGMFKIRFKIEKLNVLLPNTDYCVYLSENVCKFSTPPEWPRNLTYYISPEA